MSRTISLVFLTVAGALLQCSDMLEREATAPLGEDMLSSADAVLDPDVAAHHSDTVVPTPDVTEPLDTAVLDTSEPLPDAMEQDAVIPSCCGPDAACPGDLVCAGGAAGTGMCLTPAEGDACWADDECEGDATCVGESVCPCDALCFAEDEPGVCDVIPSSCCIKNDDCEQGHDCHGVQVTMDFGVCKPHPQPGKCWEDVDCGEEEVCQGASFCPCGLDCMVADMPGDCIPEPNVGCCSEDTDCDEGQTCYAPSSDDIGTIGICKEPPALGQCWGTRTAPRSAFVLERWYVLVEPPVA